MRSSLPSFGIGKILGHELSSTRGQTAGFYLSLIPTRPFWHHKHPIRSVKILRRLQICIFPFSFSLLPFVFNSLLSSLSLSSLLYLSSHLMSISFHLFVFLCSPLFLSLLICVSLSFVGSLFLFSMTMTMSLVQLALSIHGVLTCPECQNAWAEGPFVVARTCSHHARNKCPSISVQASCHME